MATQESSVQESKPQRRYFHKKKFCKFCTDSSLKIDYKQPEILRDFLTERGKIMPRRLTGTCARHQRQLTSAIKRARTIAFLPYVTLESK